jgi:hypothetical protein
MLSETQVYRVKECFKLCIQISNRIRNRDYCDGCYEIICLSVLFPSLFLSLSYTHHILYLFVVRMPINGHSRKGSLLVGGEGIDIKKGKYKSYTSTIGQKMGGDERGHDHQKIKCTRSRQPSILLLSLYSPTAPSSSGVVAQRVQT